MIKYPKGAITEYQQLRELFKKNGHLFAAIPARIRGVSSRIVKCAFEFSTKTGTAGVNLLSEKSPLKDHWYPVASFGIPITNRIYDNYGCYIFANFWEAYAFVKKTDPDSKLEYSWY